MSGFVWTCPFGLGKVWPGIFVYSYKICIYSYNWEYKYYFTTRPLPSPRPLATLHDTQDWRLWNHTPIYRQFINPFIYPFMNRSISGFTSMLSSTTCADMTLDQETEVEAASSIPRTSSFPRFRSVQTTSTAATATDAEQDRVKSTILEMPYRFINISVIFKFKICCHPLFQ